jgi:bacterioferritin (cytochrome b1)
MSLYNLLEKIVQHNESHAKWLNTLSYMENAGARKISACEHPSEVNLIQLKHAAEEHRHAYYLKKQILRVNSKICENYRNEELLASTSTKQYLHSLDIKTCKYLQQNFSLKKEELKYAAYLFVTYAIEVRADKLYPVYQEILTKYSSKVMVKSIILEEEGHLEEMVSQLDKFSEDWKSHAECILKIENELHEHWIQSISQEMIEVNHV